MSHPTQARSKRNVILIAIIAGVGGLLFGYDTGNISGALLYITPDFGLTTFQQSTVTSSLLVGAVVGSLVSGRLSDRYGRRVVVLLAAVVFGVGALLAGLAPGYWVLVVARVILGLAVGTASLLVPLYIAELAPPRFRGALVSMTSLMVTSGIMLAYGVDYLLAETEGWRWMLGLAVVPSVILGIGMLALPETPRWLITRDRRDDARQVLRRTREESVVETEMREIEEVAREETGGYRDLLNRSLRVLLLLGAGLAIMQQITGVNAVIYFAPTILTDAGFGDAAAILSTFGIGVVNVAFTVVAILVVDRMGRRRLLLVGNAGMAIALALLGVSLFAEMPGALTVLLLMAYMAIFSMSLGPVVWLLLAEIYPLYVRGAAMAFGSAVLWAANFVVATAFLPLGEAITAAGAFWVFAGICVVSFVFVYLVVPETKGRTLEEIEADLRGGAGGRGRESPTPTPGGPEGGGAE